VTVILDPKNSQSLAYLVVGGLVGGLFLSARSTAIVFLATFLGLLLLPTIVPVFPSRKMLMRFFLF